MSKKTTQCLKISASWTPEEAEAADMTAAMFAGSVRAPLSYHGGRLSLKAAFKTDYANPDHMNALSARIAEIKASLEDTGTLHSFEVSAGAVPNDEAIDLAEFDKELAEAEEREAA